ncbi:MAG TPA: RtcB family protein, partial [Candidatus Synoicihabitans sp.]|nr:RtcB family protein [Candidatus Synoicihabitans sp.]
MKPGMELKARDLLAAGWREDRRLGAALRRGRELEAAGQSREDTLAQLEQEYPKQAAVQGLRETAAPVAEAIAADTDVEAANLAAARARLQELLHVPVVKRGALMPDACPAGGGRATIPVGGAVEVENAIIPGGHSADICCSMFATFFTPNHPIGEMMDHLQKTTHFGAGGRPRSEQFSSVVLDEPVWENPFLSGLRPRAEVFLATQGDGNHFAYLGRIQFTDVQRAALATAGYLDLASAIERHDGRFSVLVTHHGSRGLGADVYKRGHLAAREW